MKRERTWLAILRFNVARNFTYDEMFDMMMAYGACDGRVREAAALYMRRFPDNSLIAISLQGWNQDCEDMVNLDL